MYLSIKSGLINIIYSEAEVGFLIRVVEVI